MCLQKPLDRFVCLCPHGNPTKSESKDVKFECSGEKERNVANQMKQVLQECCNSSETTKCCRMLQVK